MAWRPESSGKTEPRPTETGGAAGRLGVGLAAILSIHASVAQLDRASVFGTEGCRFESCRAYCKSTGKPVLFAFEVLGEFRRSDICPQKSSNPFRHEGRSSLHRGGNARPGSEDSLGKDTRRSPGNRRPSPVANRRWRTFAQAARLVACRSRRRIIRQPPKANPATAIAYVDGSGTTTRSPVPVEKTSRC